MLCSGVFQWFCPQRRSLTYMRAKDDDMQAQVSIPGGESMLKLASSDTQARTLAENGDMGVQVSSAGGAPMLVLASSDTQVCDFVRRVKRRKWPNTREEHHALTLAYGTTILEESKKLRDYGIGPNALLTIIVSATPQGQLAQHLRNLRDLTDAKTKSPPGHGSEDRFERSWIERLENALQFRGMAGTLTLQLGGLGRFAVQWKLKRNGASSITLQVTSWRANCRRSWPVQPSKDPTDGTFGLGFIDFWASLSELDIIAYFLSMISDEEVNGPRAVEMMAGCQKILVGDTTLINMSTIQQFVNRMKC